MSTLPPLVIGIPSFGRPERCQAAIASVFWQSLPARVIVADDSDNDETEEMCRQFADHPHFSYRRSPAKTLWQNWRWVAEAAVDDGATYFTWLQNDDVLSPKFSRRVVRSFEQFKSAKVYCASLRASYNNMLGISWSGNWGPKIALDHLFHNPITFPGELLVPIGYCDSWCMSPAKSFRAGPEFKAMLEWLPDECDSFTEVLDIAYMGMHGPAIADPVPAGYWMWHTNQESYLTKDQMDDQVTRGLPYLDQLMDQVLDWRRLLMDWSLFMTDNVLLSQYKDGLALRRTRSPYAEQLYWFFEELISIRKVA